MMVLVLRELDEGIAGTGSLSIPYAFAKVGYIKDSFTVGWYYSIHLPLRYGMRDDDYCYLRASGY